MGDGEPIKTAEIAKCIIQYLTQAAPGVQLGSHCRMALKGRGMQQIP